MLMLLNRLDYFPKTLVQTVRAPKLVQGAKHCLKCSYLWVGGNSVTDVRQSQTDRQTDCSCHNAERTKFELCLAEVDEAITGTK